MDCSAFDGGIGDPGVVLAAGQRLSCEEGPACHAELVTVCTEVAAAVELHHLPGQAAQPPASMDDTSWTAGPPVLCYSWKNLDSAPEYKGDKNSQTQIFSLIPRRIPLRPQTCIY